MESKYLGRCYYCQTDIEFTDLVGEQVCPKCGQNIGKERAVKYFRKIENMSQEDVISAHGEAYHEAGLIMDRAEFFLQNGDYSSAENELNSALKLTNSDCRVWMGFVKLHTKNLTDYRSTTYDEYLKKALAVADEEQTARIKEEFAEFYRKSKMSDEELLALEAEELSVETKMIEEGLKGLIPDYAVKQKNVKTYLAVAIACAVAMTTLAVLYAVMHYQVMIILSAVLAFGAYFFFRKWYVTKEVVMVFNDLVDVYDAYTKFDLSALAEKDLISHMSALCEKIYDKEAYSIIMREYGLLCLYLVELKVDKVEEFIKSHKHLNSSF